MRRQLRFIRKETRMNQNELTQKLEAYRSEAKENGVFLPLQENTEPLFSNFTLNGKQINSRIVLQPESIYDAEENGAPSEATISRYCDAVRACSCGLVWIEPTAFTEDGRADAHQLMLTEENTAQFCAFANAIRQASQQAHGSKPIILLTLTHAGRKALSPVRFTEPEENEDRTPEVTDETLLKLIVRCGVSAALAEKAGFDGTALQASDRSLFGESLAAYHRDGRFGGDFDDRTRFIRDCYTAMRVASPNLIYAVRLSLSDGIPQPYGWGMAFEAESHPDVYEPCLLLNILRELYGIELVTARVGIPGLNWMQADEPESELIRVSRLCTCIAMVDSNLQQDVKLIVPDICEDIPFENLAAGMIGGEFASFAAYTGFTA